MPPGLSKGLRRGLFDTSTPQPQVSPFSNEHTIPISGGTSIDGASHGTKHAPSTASVPQHRTNLPSIEPMVPNSIDTSSNGASRGSKRGSSTVLAPQPQRNPTSHEPTILTSIGTSNNGVHRRSNRRVSAISVPQSQMNMSSESTSPILDGTSTDSASKSFKKVRGRTRCLASERALHAAGRKLSVTIKAEDGRPSGANSKFFVTEIGFIIRTFAPLQYECFGNIPDQEKESLVFRLLNEMIELQKEQEGLDEVKRLSEKEICMKVLGKRSACVFSFKSTNRAEELEAENEKLKSELQEMKATMAGVKDMQKMINQLQDFQKRIEGVSPSTPTDASMD